MRYYPLARLVLFIALFMSSFAAAFAQGSASVFEGAVDQINCETIRFIHREANRSEVANNMECLSFESINKSIPEDEASTTGQLAKSINAIKTKYSADKDLGTQLDAAISIAVKKIESKTRKQNIPDFKKKLADIKAEAIKNAAAVANGGEADNAAADEADDNAADNNTAATTADNDNDGSIVIQPDGEESKEPVTTKGGVDWLGWLSLIISLLALTLAGYGFMKKTPAKAVGSVYRPADADNANAYRGSDDSSAIAVKNLETRLQQEVNRLRTEFDEKIASITASTGYTEPESMPEMGISSSDDMDGGIPSLSDAMVETMDLPIETAAMEEIEEHSGHIQKEELHTPAVRESVNTMRTPESKGPEAQALVMEEEQNEAEEELAQFEITSEEIEAMPEPEPALFAAGAPAPEAYVAQQADSLPGLLEEEEEEGLPFYRYIGAPTAQGTFPDSDLSDAAGQSAVYEVEMYEDVPNKAFFSPLPYPEVISRVLADPATYLAPCCSYTEDPAGRNHIIVDEEGTLRKEGDQWVVHDKAKIRFA